MSMAMQVNSREGMQNDTAPTGDDRTSFATLLVSPGRMRST
jgi:hypothetical protein